MNIYRTVPRFNQATGEPIKDSVSFSTVACDFCGHVTEEGYSPPDPTYKIEESNNQDPQYYQDHLSIQMGHQKIMVDLNALAHDHPEFTYCQPRVVGMVRRTMVIAMVRILGVKRSSILSIMRVLRVR